MVMSFITKSIIMTILQKWLFYGKFVYNFDAYTNKVSCVIGTLSRLIVDE